MKNIIDLKIPQRNNKVLHAKLELPADNNIHEYAIFAHCFTCNSDLGIVRNISRNLTLQGIAVLRFDFTGLGKSEGDFENTNFSNNVSDIVDVANFLAENYQKPGVLIGHSLGGTAILMAASQIADIKALVTIGSPSEPQHVSHLFGNKIDQIEEHGEAEVNIGGRPFTIQKQFIQDLNDNNLYDIVKQLKIPYLILHSPQDKIVGIENAANLYKAAFHPKSFVSLDGADHLLTNKRDSTYAANIIGTWMSRYIEIPESTTVSTEGEQVVAHLNLENNFTTQIFTEKHHFIADEPASSGGADVGPAPYELINAGLGACTVMTLKLYAELKKWDLQEVKVYLSHVKKDRQEIDPSSTLSGKVDYFKKRIELIGNLDADQREKLMIIASKCPVNRTLTSEVIMDSEEFVS